MDHSAVKQQVTDLPSSFKRYGPHYRAFSDSLIVGLLSHIDKINFLENQFDLTTASSSWLDIWGLLFNLPRYSSENDATYRLRIKETLQAWASTIPGIGKFLKNVYDLDVNVVENLTTATYQLQFSTPLSHSMLDKIAFALNGIRPAGIPFLPFNMVSTGPFTDTSGFIGMTSMTGSYLSGGTSGYTPSISSSTPATISRLPTDLLNFSGLNATG